MGGSNCPTLGSVDGQKPVRVGVMKAKRVCLTTETGLEVRLFDVEVYRTRPTAREIFAVNHSAALRAEWEGGFPIAYLFLKQAEGMTKGIPLGLVARGGMKFLEYLANH